MAADFTLIDDTSLSISYTSGWFLGGTTNEYNNSTHGTTTSGSQATIKFTGSSIDVYGTIGRENNGDASFASVSSYTIDADPNSIAVFTATPGDVVLYRQPLYTSPTLASERQHTLVIIYLVADKSPLWLDYVRIRREADTPSSTSSSSLSSSATFSPTPSRDSLQPTSPPSRPPSFSKGVIAGIAIGGFVALCLLIAIIIISRRSLTNRPNGSGPKSTESHTRWPWRPSPSTGITPFDAAAPTSQRSMNTDSSVLHRDQTSGFGSGSGTGYTTRGGTHADKMIPYTHPAPLYHQASH